MIALLAIAAGLFFSGTRFAASYYYGNGVKQYERGNYPAARRSLEYSLRWNAQRPETHFYLGRTSLGKVDPDNRSDVYPDADYPQAISHYEQAVSLGLEKANSQFYSRAVNDLGRAYWLRKEYAKADANFLEHIRVSPQLAFLSRQLLAEDYFNRLLEPGKALETLLPAIDSARTPDQQRNLFQVYARLSRIYQYFDDFGAMERYARLALESGAENNEIFGQIAHNSLALALGRKGDFAGAEAEIGKSKALAGSPRAHECVLALAYTLGGNYAKAIAVASSVPEPAAGSFSYFPACLRTLADAYQARGNAVMAKKYMEEYLRYTDDLKNKNVLVEQVRKRFAEALGR